MKDRNKVADRGMMHIDFDDQHLDSIFYDVHWIRVNRPLSIRERREASLPRYFSAPKWSNPNA